MTRWPGTEISAEVEGRSECRVTALDDTFEDKGRKHDAGQRRRMSRVELAKSGTQDDRDPEEAALSVYADLYA